MSEYSPKLYNAYQGFFMGNAEESVKIYGTATGLDEI